MLSRKGQNFLDYAMIIGVVAFSLFSMTTYLRRSMQAKVKDLTDAYIADKQLSQIAPNTKSAGENRYAVAADDSEIQGQRSQSYAVKSYSSQSYQAEDEEPQRFRFDIPEILANISGSDDGSFVNYQNQISDASNRFFESNDSQKIENLSKSYNNDSGLDGTDIDGQQDGSLPDLPGTEHAPDMPDISNPPTVPEWIQNIPGFSPDDYVNDDNAPSWFRDLQHIGDNL